METPDYLTYKKLKQQYDFDKAKPHKPFRANSFLKFFVATFIFCFVSMIYLTNRYSAKMDIEYEKGYPDRSQENSILGDNDFENQEKSTIDRRLQAIYNEEIGLSTARAVKQEGANPIDSEQYEKIKSEQAKMLEVQSKTDNNEKLAPRTFALNEAQEQQLSPLPITHTKILIGKYRSLEDARRVQEQIKSTAEFSALSPFVRKIGDIYSIQVGSYANLEIAKDIADKFTRAGYGVWIVQ